jgi:hypothetical protein
MLLADTKPAVAGSSSPDVDVVGAALRMARLYYDRYSWVLDWSNVHGKTALHIASSKGTEELVRVRPQTSGDFVILTCHIRCCVTWVRTLISLIIRGTRHCTSLSLSYLLSFLY